jgi:hypothetical protein
MELWNLIDNGNHSKGTMSTASRNDYIAQSVKHLLMIRFLSESLDIRTLEWHLRSVNIYLLSILL